ncbi:hypothetical protein H4R34_001408 [Dimargaris verticillata]|uniref:Uncharacterized protein n=1 Tax=Dimargaris verticillata TaxID=2761393 RepID=A0A9W8EEI6_9FUNG|nr:hypothetical protein H4R34_001408 [Dimargaris verticillata]
MFFLHAATNSRPMALDSSLDQLRGVLGTLGQLDFHKPTADLRCLLPTSHATDPVNGLPIRFRSARPSELVLLTPEFEQQFSAAVGQVDQLVLGPKDKRCLTPTEFEELFERTVDLAELCDIPEFNERLDQVAVQYEALAESSQVLRNQLNDLLLTFPEPTDPAAQEGDERHQLTTELAAVERKIRQAQLAAVKKRRLLEQLDKQLATKKAQRHRSRTATSTIDTDATRDSLSDGTLADQRAQLHALVAQKTQNLRDLLGSHTAQVSATPHMALDPVLVRALSQHTVALTSTQAASDLPPRPNSKASFDSAVLQRLQATLEAIQVTTEDYRSTMAFSMAAVRQIPSAVAHQLSADSAPAQPPLLPQCSLEATTAMVALAYLHQHQGQVRLNDLKAHLVAQAPDDVQGPETAARTIYMLAAKGWVAIDRSAKVALVRLCPLNCPKA